MASADWSIPWTQVLPVLTVTAGNRIRIGETQYTNSLIDRLYREDMMLKGACTKKETFSYPYSD